MNRLTYKAYIYPNISGNDGMNNPYLKHFVGAFENRIDFLNWDNSSHLGIFDIIKYLKKIDIIFLNWPEDLPDRKGGIIQAVFFFFLIFYLKRRKVKIFWTLHNKESHKKDKIWLKRYLRDFIMNKSDYIITHAKAGILLLEKLLKSKNPKIHYIPHPILPAINIETSDKKIYDVLLWGIVLPYKGIDRFLKFLKDTKTEHLRILIAGKIPDNNYRQLILSFKSEQIEIRDNYISINELEHLIAQSKIVLFTYLEESILSSGALMDSLRYTPLIIGPNFGAFKDMGDDGVILTYNDYKDLLELLNLNLKATPDVMKIKRFIQENSWRNFGDSVYNLISRG